MDLEAGFEPRTKAQEPILSYEPHGLSRSFLPEVYTCPHPSDFQPGPRGPWRHERCHLGLIRQSWMEALE